MNEQLLICISLFLKRKKNACNSQNRKQFTAADMANFFRQIAHSYDTCLLFSLKGGGEVVKSESRLSVQPSCQQMKHNFCDLS